MRGLKTKDTAILQGYQLFHNYIRPHKSLDGKTPAQAARMNVSNNWKGLIDEATKHEATILVNALKATQEKECLKVISK